MKHTKRALSLTLAAVLAGTALAQDKVPTIKEIMGRLNKPGGLYPTISRELKADDTDWAEVQQDTRSFAKLAAELGKNAAPKGDPESWAKLTKEYADNARALEDAAGKKDRAAATAARGRLGSRSCKTCHDAHKNK
jgi:cytochrome c556